MSLHEKMPCAREGCGHARHEHASRDTKQGKVKIHCRRCACPEFVEPDYAVLVERRLGTDIDQNDWMGRMQAVAMLADYEAQL